ncbi:PLC-like phosphodiesterase [Cubamyces sp. BRFM 1775]|nr:PLC-like phosphodiesterase [Cubamyces sp. BRFM 1775]
MSDSSSTPNKLPECWGHRGASAAFPENTLASFERAMRDGAEGIESDVHVSLDDVVIMFHDPTLDRTTNGHGNIRDQNWYGPNGMEHLRTTKEPQQPIPTFAQTVELLMKPENRHVTFNVDVKVFSEPTRLFTLMHTVIAGQPDWQTALAPRILLGLWHPRFLAPAKTILPYCTRSFIGRSTAIGRQYFWDSCDVFSINFSALVSGEGQSFREECKKAGKKVMAWTVNEPAEMMECVRMGVDVILTDRTKVWLDLREELKKDREGVMARYGRSFLWTSPQYYLPMRKLWENLLQVMLVKYGGPLEGFENAAPTSVEPASAAAKA